MIKNIIPAIINFVSLFILSIGLYYSRGHIRVSRPRRYVEGASAFRVLEIKNLAIKPHSEFTFLAR